MKSKLDTWVQVATAIAVLVGLALVIYELRQTKELTRLQLTQASSDEIQSEQIALLGENGASALRKACLAPETLTDDELFVVHYFFRNRVTRVFRYKEQDDLADFDNNWRAEGGRQLNEIAGYPQGKAWLSQVNAGDPEIQALVDFVIEAPPVWKCDYISEMKVK